MRSRMWLMAGCMAFGTATLAPALVPALAQQTPTQADKVTGVTVMVGKGGQAFLLMPSGTWVRLEADGTITGEFREVNRLGSGMKVGIYLHDLITDERLVIDTADNVLLNVERKQIGTVTQVSTRPNAQIPVPRRTVAAAPPPPPAPKPLPVPQVAPVGAGSGAVGTADEFNPLFDPYADPAAQQTAPVQQTAQQTVQPPTTRTIGPSGGGFRASVDAQAQSGQTTGWRPPNSGGVATAQTPAMAGQYAGPWVSLGADSELHKIGDGITGPITWILPETIMVSNPNETYLSIYFDNINAGDTIQASKTAPGVYKSGEYTITIAPVRGNYTMEITGGRYTRENPKRFMMATTADKTLSRERFENSNGEDRKSSWNQSTFAAGYDYMRYSYRGEKMNLMNPLSGRAKPVFILPGPTDYTQAEFLQKNLPFGLRGEKEASADVRQFETMISNASTFQKSTSFNFGGGFDSGGGGNDGGGGGGKSKGGSLGIEYAASQTAGRSASGERVRAQAFAHIDQYRLYQDKANQQLDPFFEADIRKLVDGQLTPAQFIDRYGTHYALAIHYGGIAEATREMTTSELRSFAQKNFSVSGEGSLKGASLKGGYSEVEAKSDTAGSMFSSTSFTSRGGTGGMEKTSWTVDETNSVPMRYDLRPLSELISPVFFFKEWDSPVSKVKFVNARRELDAAITRYMAQFPPLPDKPIGPRLYRLQFHSIRCLDNVGDGGEPAVLYGQIAAVVNHMDGVDTPILFKAEEGAPITLPCGPSAVPYKIVAEPMFIASARSGSINDTTDPTQQNPLAFFQIVAGKLYEQDPTDLDLDDELDELGVWIVLNEWNAEKPREDIIGLEIGDRKGLIGPTLQVKVSWKEIQ